MSVLIEIFETLKTSDGQDVKGVYFFDKEKKDIIFIHNDIIKDEHNNIYVGYRFIEDIVKNNENNTIKICSIGKIDKRIESGRYIFGGTSSEAIQSISGVISMYGISPQFIIKFMENFEVIDPKLFPSVPAAEIKKTDE